MNDGIKLIATLADDAAQGLFEKLSFMMGEDEIGSWAVSEGNVETSDLMLMASFSLDFKDAPPEALYRYAAGDLGHFKDVGGWSELETARLKAFSAYKAIVILLDSELDQTGYKDPGILAAE